MREEDEREEDKREREEDKRERKIKERERGNGGVGGWVGLLITIKINYNIINK